MTKNIITYPKRTILFFSFVLPLFLPMTSDSSSLLSVPSWSDFSGFWVYLSLYFFITGFSIPCRTLSFSTTSLICFAHAISMQSAFAGSSLIFFHLPDITLWSFFRSFPVVLLLSLQSFLISAFLYFVKVTALFHLLIARFNFFLFP